MTRSARSAADASVEVRTDLSLEFTGHDAVGELLAAVDELVSAPGAPEGLAVEAGELLAQYARTLRERGHEDLAALLERRA